MPLPEWPATSLGAAHPETGEPLPGAGADGPLASLAPAEFAFLRAQRTRTAIGGYTVAEVAVDGSPFLGNLMWRSGGLKRDEAEPGVATVDRGPYLMLQDAGAGVRVNDVALIASIPDPLRPGEATRAKVIRVHDSGGKLQVDLELGAV
jgi:hypothetical protein